MVGDPEEKQGQQHGEQGNSMNRDNVSWIQNDVPPLTACRRWGVQQQPAGVPPVSCGYGRRGPPWILPKHWNRLQSRQVLEHIRVGLYTTSWILKGLFIALMILQGVVCEQLPHPPGKGWDPSREPHPRAEWDRATPHPDEPPHPRWEHILNSDYETFIPNLLQSSLTASTSETTSSSPSSSSQSFTSQSAPGERVVTSHNHASHHESLPHNSPGGSTSQSSPPPTALPSSPAPSPASTSDLLHYHIETPSKSLPLRLMPNLGLLHHNFKVFRRKAPKPGKDVEEPFWAHDCLFHGHIVGEEDSFVTLYLCEGMMGSITTNSGGYFIEPLPSHLHHLHGLQQQREPHLSAFQDDLQKLHQVHNLYNMSVYPSIEKNSTSYAQQSQLLHSKANQQNTVRFSFSFPHIIYKHHHGYQQKVFQGPHPTNQYVKEDTTNGTNNFCQHTTDKSVFEQTFQFRTNTSSTNISHSRRKRSVSPRLSRWQHPIKIKGLKRHVETIVVVDKEMVKLHGSQNVTTYVLTLLNMVSGLFNDNTIGSKINITLVALIILEGDEPGLEVGHQADHTLTNFCRWQSSLRGTHHDHAILLTGIDICSYKNSPCDTLGFAPIRGMCRAYRSCTINEDTGLGTAFTISHELGHNLGMFHDGEGNYCKGYAGSIMAPTLLGYDGTFKWSSCSRKYLHRFLKTTQSVCLSDEPRAVSQLQFPDKLPGELYDADIQCHWQFGRRARLCMFDFAKDVCKSLWCFTGGRKCETKFLPAAEGTSCGQAKWCRKGVCVSYGDEGPAPVDGGWSPFTAWGLCSRPCGGGVMHRERFCSRPRPQYGGQDCDGDSRIYKMCNHDKCEVSEATFRQQQCGLYNQKRFRGAYYTWTPYLGYFSENDRCRLYCRAEGFNFYYPLSEKVTDGTRCVDGSEEDVCVEGVCLKVGCDSLVDSGASLDRCGVCKGDNTTCHLIYGNFSNHHLTLNTYHRVVQIPQGARSIVVQEAVQSTSYLAVRAAGRAHYYLTGHWRISWPNRYLIGGAVFLYERPYNTPERLYSTGPLTEDIVIEILAISGPVPEILYEYTLPRPLEDQVYVRPDNYTWTVTTSQCDAPCATGRKRVSVSCLRNLLHDVDDGMCAVEDRPATGSFPCNTQPCPPRWVAGEWEPCSQTCGGGTQRRRIRCMQRAAPDRDERVRGRLCRRDPRPPRRQLCNEHECPPDWYSGPWSKCSVTCAAGVKRREVMCRGGHHATQPDLPDSLCKHSPKPSHVSSCRKTACPKPARWFLSAPGPCSVTCGEGTRTRTLQCSAPTRRQGYRAVAASQCAQLPRPEQSLTESCRRPPCPPPPKPRWFVAPWSTCSLTCGMGVQSRLVKCMDETSGQPASSCMASDRPATTLTCQTQPCTDQEKCEDMFKWCPLVPKHNLCSHTFYKQRCCVACRGQK